MSRAAPIVQPVLSASPASPVGMAAPPNTVSEGSWAPALPAARSRSSAAGTNRRLRMGLRDGGVVGPCLRKWRHRSSASRPTTSQYRLSNGTLGEDPVLSGVLGLVHRTIRFL